MGAEGANRRHLGGAGQGGAGRRRWGVGGWRPRDAWDWDAREMGTSLEAMAVRAPCFWAQTLFAQFPAAGEMRVHRGRPGEPLAQVPRWRLIRGARSATHTPFTHLASASIWRTLEKVMDRGPFPPGVPTRNPLARKCAKFTWSYVS